ncbi:quinoprotein dehydrogenase-associated putative ABC transporter substrate-binding protein [Mesorhizobium denitrificans]|uniref:Quinoprotein dehydrogenase-associated putative ABC transporter substrate-binding protein n=2 Tax=Mesorhizobium denitrificans TaxID=2294114 RepID=A0A371XC13_9HYPH|nr:quinoprotein dehydrogenase-associated putative ABC transporter substrate-binding protein [Mesorhizobium denitrificans]
MRTMRKQIISLTLALAILPGSVYAQTAGLGAAGELVDPDVLRVCADPANLPFTDEKGEGYENKLAQLVAEKTGRKSISYTWFPMVMGFVRNTLRANRCDIIMGYAQGDELVQNTNAYLRAPYVLMYKKGGPLEGVETIEDPKLADKRVGVVQSTPPASNMAKANLMKKAKIYDLMRDTRFTHSPAELMIKDIESGEIDAAVVWGPMGGYFAKQMKADLAIVPLTKETTGSRMIYRITMGVRPSDQEWKRTLNTVIRENQPAINKILLDYGVPLIDEQNRPITE